MVLDFKQQQKRKMLEVLKWDLNLKHSDIWKKVQCTNNVLAFVSIFFQNYLFYWKKEVYTYVQILKQINTYVNYIKIFTFQTEKTKSSDKLKGSKRPYFLFSEIWYRFQSLKKYLRKAFRAKPIQAALPQFNC